MLAPLVVVLSINVVVTGAIITVLLGTDGSKKSFGSERVIGKVGQPPSVVFCPALEAANTRTTNMPIRSDCNADLFFMIFPRLVFPVVFSDRRNREPSFTRRFQEWPHFRLTRGSSGSRKAVSQRRFSPQRFIQPCRRCVETSDDVTGLVLDSAWEVVKTFVLISL